jgi:ABC-type multidrug transport system ATPase subunit
VLFLDEPTSGLDSFTALTVIESLKQCVSRRKTTVLCVIHQPRADVFNLFDSVLLLSAGGFATYFGPIKEMIPYFERQGFHCPFNSNPADYFVDICAVNKLKPLQAQVNRIRRLSIYFHDSSRLNKDQLDASSFQSSAITHEEFSVKEENRRGRFGPNCLNQFNILFKRSFLLNIRDRPHLLSALLEQFCLGFLVAGVFWQLRTDTFAAFQSRAGLFYSSLSMRNLNLITTLTNRYEGEIHKIDRELQDHLYTPSCYMIARTCSLFPEFLLQTLIFTLIVYFASNLRLTEDGKSHYGVFYSIFVIMILFINGQTWFCFSLSRNRNFVLFISQLIHFFYCITLGFMINFNSIPMFIRWVKDINVTSYAYRILMINEFKDNFSGQPTDGNSFLNAAGISITERKMSWILMILIIFITYFIAAVQLEYIKFPPIGSISNKKKTKSTKSVQQQENATNGNTGNDTNAIREDDDTTVTINTIKENISAIKEENESSEEEDDEDGVTSEMKVKIPCIQEERNEEEKEDDDEDGDGDDDEEEDDEDDGDKIVHKEMKDEISTGEDGNHIFVTNNEDKTKRVYDIEQGLKAASVCTKNNDVQRTAVSVKVLTKSPGKKRSSVSDLKEVTIEVKNLSLYSVASSNSSHSNGKRILSSVSFKAKPGNLIALMGGSGCGKTSLLNVLGNRIDCSIFRKTRETFSSQDYRSEGSILFNGVTPSINEVNNLIAFGTSF